MRITNVSYLCICEFNNLRAALGRVGTADGQSANFSLDTVITEQTALRHSFVAYRAFCASALPVKSKKGIFHIAQYPVRWTAQRALHIDFTPLADLFIPAPTTQRSMLELKSMSNLHQNYQHLLVLRPNITRN